MDTDEVLRLLQDVAAEVIEPRFRSLAHSEIKEKKPGDLVTIADQEAEVLITEALLGAYPSAVVLGEEAYAHDPALMDRFSVADHAFTVDPVDGTKNFVNGSPDHAVMVSELRAGQVVRGWIWQPQHETAYVAEAGAGAWRNGVRLESTTRSPVPAEWRGVSSRWPWLKQDLPGLQKLELTWVCCGVDYPKLIEGAADFIAYARALPWDHAPGSLITEEAGGVVTTLSGGRYDARRTQPGLLVAGSAEVHDGVRPLLSPLR